MKSLLVPNILHIKRIYSLHYFEFTKTYRFAGERHDFWEFQYVDKGRITVTADGTEHALTQGEAIFHKPNEYHASVADGKSNPNLMVLSFECNSDIMKFYENRVVAVREADRARLAEILGIARESFANRLDDEVYHTIRLREDCDPVQLQALILHLELFLLSAYRHCAERKPQLSVNRGTAERIMPFLRDNVDRNLTLSDLERAFAMNRNYLNKIFGARFGKTIGEAYIDCKIEAAKDYLRDDELNVRQISDRLGYNTPEYFSKQFHKKTGFSPTEFKRSLAQHTPKS